MKIVKIDPALAPLPIFVLTVYYIDLLAIDMVITTYIAEDVF